MKLKPRGLIDLPQRETSQRGQQSRECFPGMGLTRGAPGFDQHNEWTKPPTA